MKFAVISTGSKANCTYVESGEEALLIDCGLSAREAGRRLTSLGIEPRKIKAILITHEHSDHIRGVPVLSRQLKIPVYANRGTAAFLSGLYAQENFVTGDSFKIGGFDINPFSIVHDASDPVGFTVGDQQRQLAQLTDLGRVTQLVRASISGCNAMVLESNYDRAMLYECGYPWDLKQRIDSAHGHLSNNDSAALLADIRRPELQHVILGHLSENSNKPELAIKTFAEFVSFSDFTTLKCGSVYAPTELIEL